MKQRLRFNVLLHLAIFILCAAACGPGEKPPRPMAIRGVMDLRQWNFERNGIVALDGEWEHYRKRYLSPGDLADPRHRLLPAYLVVPNQGAFTAGLSGEEAMPQQGYATYRLRIQLPHGTPLLSLNIPHIPNAYILYINGVQRCAVGRAGTTPAETIHALRPVTIDITQAGPVIDLVIQSANFNPVYRQGIWHQLHLGETRTLARISLRGLFNSIVIFAGILIMGLYHFIVYLQRRGDRSPLYFGILCLVVAAYLYLHGGIFTVHITGDIPITLLARYAFIIMFSIGPVFFLYFRSIFPNDFSTIILRLMLGVGFIGIIIALTASDEILFLTRIPFLFLSSACGLYSAVVLVRSCRKKEPTALIMLAGYCFLYIASIYEILTINEVIRGESFLPTALFVFMILQAYLLSVRFSSGFMQAEKLTGELEGKNIRLTELDRLKDEFLANTSHELRTPLNGIIGLAESLADSTAGGLTPRARTNLTLIAASGRRLANLVNDILDYSRLKNHDITLQPAAQDLRTIVDVIIALLQPLVGDRDLRMINAIPPEAPRAWADENRLMQVLHNLVGNAVKFTEKGYIVIAAETCPGEGGDFIRVSVADTGIGIPEEKRQSIFLPFEQVDGTIARHYGGTGIGLSISRHLVELHGGTIQVTDNESGGSTFSFTLPCSVENGGSGPTIAHRRPEAPATVPVESGVTALEVSATDTPSGTVLVVDDDPVNLAVAMGFLAHEGYAVHTARTGDEALNVIAEMEGETRLPFDCVLLDLMMPGISGYDVCRRIRRTYTLHELPVLMVTARNGLEDLVLGFESGTNDYITKPLKRPELMVRVKTLVTMKRSAQEQREARYRLLQDRMKPHFLFNALNSIYYFMKRDTARASTALLTLANIYRFLMNETNRHLISFDEEWAFAGDYLEMQQIQYQGMLECTIVREGDFSGVLLPPLTIQPLVENAFKHGFKGNPDGGHITLTASRIDDTVRVTVMDNGVGLSGTDHFNRSLGNIRQRLAYYYPDAYLTMENRPEGGAMAQLILGGQQNGSA